MQDCIGALFSSDSIRIVVLYIGPRAHRSSNAAQCRAAAAAGCAISKACLFAQVSLWLSVRRPTGLCRPADRPAALAASRRAAQLLPWAGDESRLSESGSLAGLCLQLAGHAGVECESKVGLQACLGCLGASLAASVEAACACLWVTWGFLDNPNLVGGVGHAGSPETPPVSHEVSPDLVCHMRFRQIWCVIWRFRQSL